MTNRTPDPRARQLAEAVHGLAREKATKLPAWQNLPISEREKATTEARLWLRAAVEAGLVDRPTPRRDVLDQAVQQQRVARARHEGAIEALRSAAEHMDIGAAIGPVPHEVRPVVVAWLRRLAEQRLGRAQREAAQATTTPDRTATSPEGLTR